jgi:hypothetical protein
MALGLESLTSELDRKETAFQSLPQSELMKKRQTARGTGLPPSLTEALVAEKVLNDKAAAANAMTASMQSDPRTVAQQNEVEIRRQAEMEVAKAVGQANANKMQRQQKNMQKLASMDPRMLQRKGLAAAPVQRKQFSAQGGIVGYQDGGFVDTLKDAGSYLTSGQSYLGGMSPLEAALTASMFIPGVGIAGGLTRAGLAGIRGLQTAKGAGMLTRGAQAAGRGLRKGVQSTYSVPKVTKKGVPLKSGARQFSPGRTAQTAGVAGLIGSKLLKPGDSTPVERELPDSTYDEVPATPKATPSADADEARRREARKRFRYIAGSAGFGTGNVSKAEREYDQQEFTNKIEQDTLIAKQQLNNINSVNVLQNRLTQVNAEIAALQEQLYNSPINAALRELEIKKQEAITDGKDVSAIQEQINLQRIASAEELERYADPQGTGDVGLLVQRRQLQARVNELQQGLMNDPMDSVVARNT